VVEAEARLDLVGVALLLLLRDLLQLLELALHLARPVPRLLQLPRRQVPLLHRRARQRLLLLQLGRKLGRLRAETHSRTRQQCGGGAGQLM
jgi:hypothetical protein